MKTEEESFYKFLGSKIASERNRFGITQDKLGEILGLSRVSIVNIEKGKQKPSIYQLFKITIQFNISLDSFSSSYISQKDLQSPDSVLGQELDEKSIMELNSFISKIKE
jgi:DNA-binding XRE family transcriptional regulator